MKLYHAPGACSLAVHIALREVGARFELVRVDLRTRKLADGAEFAAVSPRGYVPVLELEDGSRHTEGAALLQHVADLEPARSLIGEAGSRRRLGVVGWLTFIGTEMHKALGALWHGNLSPEARATVARRADAHFAELDQRLQAQPYLAGDYSVADAYAFTIVSWTRPLGISLEPYPALRGYLGHIAARPNVRAALAAEGLAG